MGVYMGVIWRLYRANGKENGNYYIIMGYIMGLESSFKWIEYGVYESYFDSGQFLILSIERGQLGVRVPSEGVLEIM